MQNGTEYFYVVRAVASGGVTGPYSSALSARPNPRAGGIAYQVPAGWVGNQDITGASVGMDFDIALPIRITRLGVFDDGGDGLLATISAHNDPIIGELVARAIEKVGAEGAVTVEEAKGTETALEVVEGLQFDRDISRRIS